MAPGGARQVRQAVAGVAPSGMVDPPVGDGVVMMLQAHGAWRCVMLARRFGPSVCLAR